MSQKAKILGVLGAIIIVGGVLVGVSLANDQSQNAQDTPATNQQQTTQHADHDSVSYKGVEGKTALELLKSSNKVETKSFEGMGEYVTSIDGHAPKDSSEFWAFYVDGKQAQVGAGEYITKDGEKIEWKLEKIQ